MQSTPQPPSPRESTSLTPNGSSPPCRSSSAAPNGTATFRSRSFTPRWRSQPACSANGLPVPTRKPARSRPR